VIHRAGNRWKAFFVILIMALICSLLSLFAYTGFNEATPRRVDLVHYMSPAFGDRRAQSKIMLGAPNSGQLRFITRDMEVYDEGWLDCLYLASGYQFKPGRCLEQL